MPGLLIQNFRSLYTNIDPDQASQETLSAMLNFRLREGYVEVEPRHLSALTDLPTLDAGYAFETGIYCTLTNDALNNTLNSTATKYDVFVLVALKYSTGTFYRKIYLQDVTDPLSPGAWEEMSKEGAVALSNINISESFYTTTIDGRTFFKVQNGRLKVYMPHDCFWIGILNRTLYLPTPTTLAYTAPLALNQFYIDRLLEDWVGERKTLVGDICQDINRQGVRLTLETVTGDTTIIESRPITMSYYSLSLVDFPGGGTGYVHQFNVTINEDGSDVPLIVAYNDSDVDTENRHWAFSENGDNNGDTMYIPTVWFSQIQRLDANLNEIIPATYATFTTDPTVNGGVAYGDFYYLTKADFLSYTDWHYIGNTTIADVGFEASVKEYSMVVTATLDERDEIIISQYDRNVDETGKWAIKISSVKIAEDLNYRTTKLKMYIKLKDDLDYELVNVLDLLAEDFSLPAFQYISDFQREGIFLTQNIGFAFDPEKSRAYKPILAFRDVATINNIGIGVANDDYTNVHYSVVGGGVIQTDLMLTQNIVPLPGVSIINALGELTTHFLAASDRQSFIVQPADVADVLAFTVQDTLEYGVQDKRDMIQAQGALFMNTSQGIISTNGLRTEIISLPINDIVKAAYNNLDTNIYYNPTLHELYYIIDNGLNYIYRLRFEIQGWDIIKWTTDPASYLNLINDIIYDAQGNITYLLDNGAVKYDSSDLTMVTAFIQTQMTDLGLPNTDKLGNYIDIDFKGALTIALITDGVVSSFNLSTATSTTRRSQKLFIPVNSRKPFKKVQFILVTSDSNTAIYRFYFDFLPLSRRYN